MSMQLRKLCGALALALAWAPAFAADVPKDAPKAEAKEAAKEEPKEAKKDAPKVGSPFPALDGFSLEGKLPDTKGKVVIVDFWATWCPPCAKALPMFKELHEKYADRGVVIVAVNVDEEQKDVEAFLKKLPLPFAVVRDVTEKLQKALDLDGLPVTYIVDRQGTIRMIHDGFAGDETKKEYIARLEELLK
jgi:thiol-disulfide isomerase/thioredoxin